MNDDAEWRSRIKAERPVLGRLAAAITAKPVVTRESQATRAWATGASGELRVAEVLADCDGVHALHGRRVPGSKANIDHIAVSPSGVYVIDAKKYTGQIEARNVGGWLREDLRLYVNGRDQTKLADAMGHQVEVVRQAMDSQHSGVPVVPVLCWLCRRHLARFPSAVRLDSRCSHPLADRPGQVRYQALRRDHGRPRRRGQGDRPEPPPSLTACCSIKDFAERSVRPAKSDGPYCGQSAAVMPSVVRWPLDQLDAVAVGIGDTGREKVA